MYIIYIIHSILNLYSNNHDHLVKSNNQPAMHNFQHNVAMYTVKALG